MGMGQELNDFATGFKTGFSMGDKYNARKDNLAIAAGYESRADYDAAQKIKAEKGLLGTKGDPSAPRAPGAVSNTGTGDPNDKPVSSDGHKADSGDAQADPILDAIRPLEGGKKDPYNTVFGGKKRNLTGLTVNQVLDTAYGGLKFKVLGAYQFKDSTLRGLIEKGRLDGSQLFNEKTQDEAALALMNGRGWQDYKNGKITSTQLMGNLSQEWASLPDPNNGGKSHYESGGVDHAGIGLKAFESIVTGKGGGAAKPADDTTKKTGGMTADTPAPTQSEDDPNVKYTDPPSGSKFTAEQAQKIVDGGGHVRTSDIQGPQQVSQATPNATPDATPNATPDATPPATGGATSAIPGRGGGPSAVAQANARQNLMASNDEEDDTDAQGNKRQMPKGQYTPPIQVAELDPTMPLGAPNINAPFGPILGAQPPPSIYNPSGVYGVSQAASGGVMERPRRLGFAAGGAAPTNANEQGSGRAYTQPLPASTAGAAPAQAVWTPRQIGQVAPGGGQNQPATSGSQAAFAAAQARVQSQIDARNAAAAQAPVHAQVDQGPFSHQAYVDSANRYYTANAPVRDPSTPPNRFTDPARAAAPYMDEGSWQQLQPGYADWAQQNNANAPRPYGARGYDEGGFVSGFASGLNTGFSSGRRFSGRRKSGITGRDSTSDSDSSDGGSYNRGYVPSGDDDGSYNRGTVDAAGGGLMKGYGQKPQPKDEHDDDRSTRADRKEAPRSDESRPPAGRPYQEGGTGTADKGVGYDPAYSTMGGGGPSPSYEPNNYDRKPSDTISSVTDLKEMDTAEDRRRRATYAIPPAHRNVSAASGDTRPPNTSELHDPGGSLPTPGDPGYHRPVNEEYDTDRKPANIISSGTELSEIDKSETGRQRAALPRDQEDRDLRSSRAAALARLEARDKAYANLDRTHGDRATRAGTEDQPSTPESTAQGEEGAGKIPTPPPRPGDIDQPPTPPVTKTAQAAPAAGTPAASPIPLPPPRPPELGDASGVAPAAQGQTPSQVTAAQPDQAATPPTPPTPPPAAPASVPAVDDYGRPIPTDVSTAPPAAPGQVQTPNAPRQVGDNPRIPPTRAAPAASPVPTPGAPTPSIPGEGGAVPGTGPGAAVPAQGMTPSNLGETQVDHPHVKPVVKPGTKVNGGGIVTHKEVQESTKAGLGSINKGFDPRGNMNKGFGVPTRGTPSDGGVTDAQKAFAHNDNAIDPQTMAKLKQQVDPDNKLGEAEKTMKVQQDLYDFYMSHGYQTKAAGVAAGVLMYGRRISQLAGNMAQAALEKGDVVTASAWMAKAYDNMPDGHELRVSKPDANGNVTYQLVDLQTGEAGEVKTASKDDMMTMAKSMSSGALWASATIDVAQGTGVGVGGGGVGKGKGGGSRAPGSLTESQRLTQEDKQKKSDLMDGFNSAVSDYKADPTNEDKKQAAQDAARNALAGGVPAANVNSILKENGLAVTKAPTSVKERAQAAHDADLQKKLDAEPDPDKKNGIKADDSYAQVLAANKGKETDGKTQDAIDQEGMDPKVSGFISPLVSSFAKANGMDSFTAVKALMSIVNGSNFQFTDDGRIQVEDAAEPYYINQNIVRALLKARAAQKAK